MRRRKHQRNEIIGYAEHPAKPGELVRVRITNPEAFAQILGSTVTGYSIHGTPKSSRRRRVLLWLEDRLWDVVTWIVHRSLTSPVSEEPEERHI